MKKKILVATEKPFAKEAVEGIEKVINGADCEMILLEKYTSKEDLHSAVKGVDTMIIRSDKVDKNVLDAASDLKIVVRAGAGYDNVDCSYASEKKVVVMNTPGQNANAVAELVFGLMLNLARRKYSGKAGTELLGKTLGIQAYGNIGKNVARIAKGFGMKVMAFDPYIDSSVFITNNIDKADTQEQLYSCCDYISLHIPATSETKKSINYQLLSSMKKGASLINTARKEVINEDDLVKIFKERNDLFFGSDLTPDCHVLLSKEFGDRVFFTAKKMGAQTNEANINAGIAAAKQIVAFLRSGDETFKVN